MRRAIAISGCLFVLLLTASAPNAGAQSDAPCSPFDATQNLSITGAVNRHFTQACVRYPRAGTLILIFGYGPPNRVLPFSVSAVRNEQLNANAGNDQPVPVGFGTASVSIEGDGNWETTSGSITFTPTGGTIDVQLESIPPGRDDLRLRGTWIDQGLPIQGGGSNASFAVRDFNGQDNGCYCRTGLDFAAFDSNIDEADVVAPPPGSGSSSISSTVSPASSGDGSFWPWIAGAIALVVAIGAGIVIATREKPPAGPVVVPQTDTHTEPCDCTCTVEVQGPERLYLCECADPSWQLRPVGNQDMGGGQTVESTNAEVLDRHRVLEASVPAGSKCPRNQSTNVLFSRDYQAPVTPSCRGGAQVTDVKRQWTLDTSRFIAGRDSQVVINVTAVVTVTCPKGTHTVQVSGQKVVSVRPDKPRVYVVINKHPTVSETGHASVRITCGEFDRIYGYFPKARHGAATLIPGAGEVQVKERDGVRQDYTTVDDFYPAAQKWIFEVPVTCAQCTEVQDYWERLRANPGRYQLLVNNCTTQALGSVEQLIGSVPAFSPHGAVELLHLKKTVKETYTPPKE